MPLFTFAEIEEVSRQAAQKNFDVKEQVVLDEHKGKFPSSSSPFVILGHTSETIYDYAITSKKEQTVGGMSAKDMAKKMAAGVVEASERAKIEDIYLVACEAGLNDSPENPSFARELAAELYKQGFINIKVHAVTSPYEARDRQQYAGMRVSLVTRPGITGRINGTEFGDAEAFLITPRYEELSTEINELVGRIDKESDISKRKVLRQALNEKKKALENEKRPFMETHNLKSELDRPENTFVAAKYPKDVVRLKTEKRFSEEVERLQQYRVKRKPARVAIRSIDVVDPKLKSFLGSLEQLILENPKDRKLKQHVTQLLNDIEVKVVNGEDWQGCIKKAIDDYHLSAIDALKKGNAKEFFKAIKKDRKASSYYNILTQIAAKFDINMRPNDSEMGQVYDKIKGKLKEKECAFANIMVHQATDNYIISVIDKNGASLDFKIKKKDYEAKLDKIASDVKRMEQVYVKIEGKLKEKECAFANLKVNETKNHYNISVIDEKGASLDFKIKKKDYEAKLDKVSSTVLKKNGKAAPKPQPAKPPRVTGTVATGGHPEGGTSAPDKRKSYSDLRSKYKTKFKVERPKIEYIQQFYRYATDGKGRAHDYEATLSGKKNKGDALKTEILQDFKATLNGLTKANFEDEVKKLLQSEEAKVIRTPQRWTSRRFNLETDSYKAFRRMTLDRAKELGIDNFPFNKIANEANESVASERRGHHL